MISEWTNHLWQSTLVAIGIAVLTLAFRKNRAQVRYWLWLSASVKFLVPFAPLMRLGSGLWGAMAAGKITTGIAPPIISVAVEQVIRPFPEALVSAAPATGTVSWTSLAILLMWMCGFASLLFIRFRGWLRLRAAVLASSPISIPAAVEIRSSPALFEPGIVGLFRPVLLLPDGILKTLTRPQLEAVLAHELCHVRRGDNLTAMLHMIVEAIFWFHPLVWWIGARLVHERECACDEHVLALGSDPQVYAESILKICSFCVETPLPCAAGVTSSDLKKRIEAILKYRAPRNLQFGQRLLLVGIAAAGMISPLAFGMLQVAQTPDAPQAIVTAPFYIAPPAHVYESVSIRSIKSKPATAPTVDFRNNGLTASNVTAQMLIQQAYKVAPYQIAGAPDWLNRECYDVEAKIEQSLADELAKGDVNELGAAHQPMLLELLADRFQLSVHRESRQLPAFALVVAKGGSKLHEARPGDTYPNGIKDAMGNSHGDVMRFLTGTVIGQGVPLAPFIQELSRQVGRPVLDQTGLTGKYDFFLTWSDGQPFIREYIIPQESEKRVSNSMRLDALPRGIFEKPSIFAALHDQLGLELHESNEQTAPVRILMIDHSEPPRTDN